MVFHIILVPLGAGYLHEDFTSLPYGRGICQNIFAFFYPIEPQLADSLFSLVLCNMVSSDLTCHDISVRGASERCDFN